MRQILRVLLAVIMLRNLSAITMNNPREYNKHKEKYCVACGHDGSFYPLDIDHVKTRGSGGGDEASNCMTLCRRCHGQKNNWGLKSFSEKYRNVKSWLEKNGWEVNPYGRWVRPRF